MSSNFLDRFRDKIQKIGRNGDMAIKKQFNVVPETSYRKLHLIEQAIYNSRRYNSVKREYKRYNTPVFHNKYSPILSNPDMDYKFGSRNGMYRESRKLFNTIRSTPTNKLLLPQVSRSIEKVNLKY
jgi:hypothetical protein